MDGLCMLNCAMVEIHAPKTVPRLVSYVTIPKTCCISRRCFMFHAVYLRKKSIQRKTKVLCLGLILLTAGNIHPRFRLVNHVGFHACQCAYGFRRYCTSRVTRIVPSTNFSISLSLFKKSLVSLT